MKSVCLVLLALCGAALASPIQPYDDGSLTETETAFYELCGKSDTVKCAGSPAELECFDNKNCTKAIAMETTDTGFAFYMIGLNDVAYVSLGFSNDTDMGAEPVVACSKNDTGIYGSLSFNIGKKNEMMDTLDGLTIVESKDDNGVLYCKFTLDDTLTFARQGGVDSLYYIVGAAGKLKTDGSLGHHSGYILSSEKWAIGRVLPDFEEDFYKLCEDENVPCAANQYEAETEGCFGFKNCTKLLAMETTDDGNVFHMLATGDVGYVALAFSNDTSMGEEAVVSCVVQDDKVTGQLSYDVGYKNFRADSDEGLSILESKVEDGVLYCKFSLENPLVYAQHEKTFTDEEYYVLAVSGPLKADGSLGVHGGIVIPDKKWTISSSSTFVSSALLAFTAFVITYKL